MYGLNIRALAKAYRSIIYLFLFRSIIFNGGECFVIDWFFESVFGDFEVVPPTLFYF